MATMANTAGESIFREIAAMKQIDHPNCVRLYEVTWHVTVPASAAHSVAATSLSHILS